MFKSVSTSLAALAMVAAAPVAANDLRDDLAADMPDLMELYRDLHAHPELSFEEYKTAAKLAKRMKALGFEVTEGASDITILVPRCRCSSSSSSSFRHLGSCKRL